MKNRIIGYLLAAALVVSSLAACAGTPESSGTSSKKESSSSTSSSSEAEPPAGGTVEIEFLQQKREATETFDKLIADFMAENPDIKVTQNTVPDAGTVLMTRAASNEMPDVLTHWPTDAAYVQFAKRGKLRDLSDSAALANVVPTYVDAIKIDSKVYAIPMSLNFMGVFYDKDKFEAAGYKTPKTWDELMTIAEDIKQKGEVAFVLPDKDSWTISQGISNIEGKTRGGSNEFYTALTEGTTTFEGDAIMVDSLEKSVLLRDYSQGDTLSLGYDQAINDFATGTGYMFIQGIWALPSIEAANPDINVGMFPMPNDKGDMKQPVGVDVAICLGANSSEEKAAAADKFVAYLTSTEAAQKYSDLDHSPSAIQGVSAKIPAAQEVLDLIDKAGVLDIAVPPAGFEETKRSKLQQLFIDKDVEALCKTMTEDWKAAVEAE